MSELYGMLVAFQCLQDLDQATRSLLSNRIFRGQSVLGTSLCFETILSKSCVCLSTESLSQSLTEMVAPSWKTLPDEVLVSIARLLLGFELLPFSHVNSHLLHLLSHPDIYAPRLSRVRYQQQEEQDTNSERIATVDSKRIYVNASSLRFIGGQSESQRQSQCYAPVFWSTDTLFGLFAREDDTGATKFTLDAWFSLSPPERGILQGGILLGLQSEKCREDGGRWPEFHCQVLHVDVQRNLYCSVTGEKSCVAAQLELRRWYHVALVYEDRLQLVYLDGEMVSEQYGQGQQLESLPYYYAQVGIGCISGDSVGKPADSYDGWYAFHGVIDDFHVWHEAMAPEQIATLSRNCGVLQRRPTFSLKRDVPVWMTHGVEMVRCSRPREGWCDVVTACKRADDRESWV